MSVEPRNDGGASGAWKRAFAETNRLQSELDITNADHVALWLEANTIPDEPMSQCISWLACRIVEAHERANGERLRGFGYLPGHYSILCMDCRALVDGCAKRAIRCLRCAETAALKATPPQGDAT